MSKRILTGIQSSGTPHLGNILGAIGPAIEMSERATEKCFYFIADMHSLTSLKDAQTRIDNTYSVAATWLALGLDIEKHLLYRQSKIPQVSELSWYLGCFMPFSRLSLAHSFKDKSDNLEDVNAGLFTYPVLMCADILLYDAAFVPVGKDQLQHVEFARDVARRINSHYKKEVFVIPESKTSEDVMIVPGIDGRKMSKSYNNFINIFLPEKKLKKRINSIVTSSTPVEEPKDPDTCNVFNIYKLMGAAEQTEALRANYLAGGFGYGAAKKELFELVMDRYAKPRAEYDKYLNDLTELERLLQKSEQQATELADRKLLEVREVLGFK
ncbi:tryptophan--tRNA ligase [Neolewinella aurantiaca]|uniref:Tryptophan--tRNA ligase n=1 Tax=Neolewinella aurantiaca TaxID=2602767 RepID=A0A5C7FQ52_9BACT|nr:tryptophan--tRNA ligase [Neolewinella aurantiaca]TXF88120.1 tryptophan--tRNA ligase [Neolewinella aurantiaca]